MLKNGTVDFKEATLHSRDSAFLRRPGCGLHKNHADDCPRCLMRALTPKTTTIRRVGGGFVYLTDATDIFDFNGHGSWKGIPAGAIVLPNGIIILPDGTRILPDGRRILPDGTILDKDGNVIGQSISNSYIAPLFFKMAQNLDLRCVLVPAPWVLGPKHVSNPE